MYLYSIDLGEKVVFYPNRRKAEQEARRALVKQIDKRRRMPSFSAPEIIQPEITRYTVRQGLTRR